MAEALIAGKDSPTRAYRRGDIVLIVPDGYVWSRHESLEVWVAEGRIAAEYPGEYYILKIPGVTVTRLQSYLDAWTDTLDLGPRRLWRVLISEIPDAIRNTWLSQGYITIGVEVTRAQVEARLRRKDTEATADLTP